LTVVSITAIERGALGERRGREEGRRDRERLERFAERTAGQYILVSVCAPTMEFGYALSTHEM